MKTFTVRELTRADYDHVMQGLIDGQGFRSIMHNSRLYVRAGRRYCILWNRFVEVRSGSGVQERVDVVELEPGRELSLREALRWCRPEDAEHLLAAAGIDVDGHWPGMATATGLLLGWGFWIAVTLAMV
jgi:hypothetical protein